MNENDIENEYMIYSNEIYNDYIYNNRNYGAYNEMISSYEENDDNNQRILFDK